MGFLLLAQSFVYAIFVQNEGSTLEAVLLLGVGCLYLPAIWASVVQTRRRRLVLRWVTGVSLVTALAGSFFLGVVLVSFLLVPTTLLAIAGELVFQGRGKR